MTWAQKHAEYLNLRRDLFLREGAENSLEGTAHCRGDRGFLFVRNATTGVNVAQIPINHWLGLDQGQWFELTQRYPSEKVIGRCRRGEDVLVPVKAGETILIEIAPTEAGERRQPEIPSGVPVQKAFLSLKEALRLLNDGDFWPALPLPGQGKMKGF